jgi:hypothetical protein
VTTEEGSDPNFGRLAMLLIDKECKFSNIEFGFLDHPPNDHGGGGLDGWALLTWKDKTNPIHCGFMRYCR